MSQIQKGKQSSKRQTEQSTKVERNEQSKAKTEQVQAETDDLLEEIDALLPETEAEAEIFVSGFVQKGGQ